MREQISILLVDDQATEQSRLLVKLQAIGIVPSISLVVPKEESQEHILQLLPALSGLNNFDYALVDLELWPSFKAANAYAPEDLKGGTVVLQYLRDNAPWLPVICYSQLFDHLELFNMSTSFGFDAHLSKKWVTSPNFSRDGWDTITKLSKQNRLKQAMGNSFVKSNESIAIDASVKTKTVLNSLCDIHEWKVMLQTLFHFSSSVFIESATSGFSGAAAFIVNATTSSAHHNTKNQWFLKVSSNIFKLHQEACAHLQFFYNGIEYARTLPLMYNAIMRFGKCGVIAYQFADNTKVAASVITSAESLRSNRDKLYALIAGYSSPSKTSLKDCVLHTLLSDWFNRDFHSYDLFTPNDELKRYITPILEETETETTQAHFKCTYAQIHGDLHLCNILFGERDVLIDFARSKSAPVVIDLAKLFSDLFIRIPELQSASLPMMSMSDIDLYTLPPELPSLNDDDKRVFDIFLRLYLVASLSYSDVPAVSKEWVKNVLS